MLGPHAPGYHYTEADWNDNASKLVKESPDQLPGIMLYLAAKTDAKHIAWNLYNDHESEVGWELVTLNPPYIFGPILQDEPNFSSDHLYRKAFEQKPEDSLGERIDGYTDVRDAAQAHDTYNELQSLNIPEIPKGVEDTDPYDNLDTSKATKILGLRYISLGDPVRDTLVKRKSQK
ncbi:hypothetical protein CALCODRAFT_488396 [Calocera cornea HHB12733]|uniref:NAD(P)-binding protein n=1 Tax=Calocera cornea HHB12733 TaxID=1353952 RepID=A0A165CHQ0_9BASI|nr:hypothetical protein CALCODRAFT_488396 [Calocera cornea HHB12733]